MGWQIRAIRGATTVAENTEPAIRQAVDELLDSLATANQLESENIVSVTFTTTPDLDAIFPAAIARTRPGWQYVPLLDVQQMHVPGSLSQCIRVLLHFNTPLHQRDIGHIYLRGASQLRPDLSLSPAQFDS
ncbi:MAG: chorismate mutase [Cyanobacteria bacterium P01_F01_bin.33]